MKRVLGFLVLLTVCSILVGSFAPEASAETIMDRIRQNQGTGGITALEQQVDESTTTFVRTARRIFVTLTVIFGLWLAITYLKGGFSPDTLRDTKGRIGFFFLFLALSYWTEQILGFVFNLFGIDLSTL
ncbi:MAG: hypothetical protein BAA01_11500 [Bacillus thermozeamaize]|mgnify:CR=1 FL=1|uniref:Uncharacterized protein n=1 Tax=Bacillus thermozeamaize TaxID=230954 RepID=A0A1Y3PKF9_9BACI|nr:MAG: hypothetical protein BAA01_11500 [Bacillus thermozeamaize]